MQIDHCVWNTAKAECFIYKTGMEGKDWVRNSSNCVNCNNNNNCASCLQHDSCAWCELTQTCFFFPLYLSKYNQGGCEAWLSKEESGLSCRSCSNKVNCKSCLKEFGCGWCYDVDNPLIGVCTLGDFQSVSNMTCSKLINSTQSNWAYSNCPAIDECSLSLHKCHRNATCINTPGSYDCKCNRGFIGNGLICEQT